MARLDRWDWIAGTGITCILAGLAWYSVPLALLAGGGILTTVGIWGARLWGSSPKSGEAQGSGLHSKTPASP